MAGKEEQRKLVSAEELAKAQRTISVAEFFTKNRHLLGFDNPRKALMTTIKETCDNSLDACEDMGVLPEIKIRVEKINEERFKVVVEDNGPGIVKEQIPKIFAQLLYGSKFHRLRQGRGQQGIGVSASLLYGQLTTGKSARILSKTSPRKPAQYFELQINTKTNEPEIIRGGEREWKDKKHGTKVEIELEGTYQKGKQSIDSYLKQTAMVNPHLELTYINPESKRTIFPRAAKQMPKEAKEIKPHPYGVELGILIDMLKGTKASTLQSFLTKDFSRVSAKTAKQICEKAGLYENARPSRIARQEADNLMKAIKETKIMAPPTNCLSPIGEELLLKGIKKELNAEFYAAVTRPPSVYRGFPFEIETAIAFGGDLDVEGTAKIYRFANRVPLLYQQSAGAISKAVIETAWRNYGVSQSKGSLPTGSIAIVVHMASVWVPFTSESKEAVAHYPEIIKEMKLALQECGRKLASYIRKTIKARQAKEKIDLFEKYIPEVAESLHKLTGEKKDILVNKMEKMLKRNIKDLRMEE